MANKTRNTMTITTIEKRKNTERSQRDLIYEFIVTINTYSQCQQQQCETICKHYPKWRSGGETQSCDSVSQLTYLTYFHNNKNEN